MPIQNLEVILFISTHCTHCASTLELLTKSIKQAKISQLTVINLEADNATEKYTHIRSVPYIKIGDFEFTGNLDKTDIDEMHNAHSKNILDEYLFSKLFSDGLLKQAEKLVKENQSYWPTLINLAKSEESKMQTRIGITAIFETQANTLMNSKENHLIIDSLLSGSTNKNHTIRVDLIYFISIIYIEMQKLKLDYPKLSDFIQKTQNDSSEEIRSIIHDALTEIAE